MSTLEVIDHHTSLSKQNFYRPKHRPRNQGILYSWTNCVSQVGPHDANNDNYFYWSV